MGAPKTALVEEVKKQLQSEMGLMPVRLLRERSASFVELNTLDNQGKAGYGTAGYLGNGFFITVKHGVTVLDDGRVNNDHRITSITLRYEDKEVPAEIVDAGDATSEVHAGDWALLKVQEEVDLPALTIDTAFAYDFAEPIFRLGNDYSKGISVSTGYVGQHMANGLVTCLTDGHPGVSGGGVLSQKGELVGIPVGRMQQDFRFSFILPVRAEMFRMLPQQPAAVVATASSNAPTQ
jgi:S1-C subfamily serine protease